MADAVSLRVYAQVRAKLAAGAMTLDKFVITKQLTKRPEDYPDAKNQPHVQVALRRKAANKRDGTMQVRCCFFRSTLLEDYVTSSRASNAA